MHTVLLVAGPPVSAPLWDDVVRRMESLGRKVQVIDLFDPVPDDPTVNGLAERLTKAVQSIEGPVVLVGHGTALPVAWKTAEQTELEGLVLTNGPMTKLDPFLATFCRLASSPRFLTSTLLQPHLLQRWLASSAGLRRTVVNPYVMDHDMVVAVSSSYLKSKTSRMAVATFLNDLPRAIQELSKLSIPTMLLWGDEDRLYPPTTVDSVRHLLPHITHERIPGGQHFHPAERPWEIADRLTNWTPKRG